MFRSPKRAAVALVAVIALVFSFELFSRYPDLNRKALMAESGTVADTISMFPILPVKGNDPFWKKVAFTTVNWAHDNRRGMAFGIVLGALLFSLFRYITFQPVKSRWANSALGMLIGTPLGVCVNCAAPVFKGALQSKRIELALALMLSSPTLNIVVVTMVFSLFPLYMALAKVALNLLVVLIGVPLMAKRLANVPIRDFSRLPQASADLTADFAPAYEPFTAAVLGFVKDFFRSLWFIFIRTAPWMIIAGFLGALLSHTIRLDSLQNSTNAGTVLITTLVGLLLPVPMAFDVVLTHALYSAGLPLPLVFALLGSLGAFSLYSFVITWKSAAPQWAMAVAALLFVLVSGVSFVTPVLHRSLYLRPNTDAYRELTAARTLGGGPTPLDPAGDQAPATAVEWTPRVTHVPGLTLSERPLQAAGPSDGKLHFLEGPAIGLERGFVYTIRDYPDPFWIGRGTGAGDFDQDGWPDLAFGSDQGPIVYRNLSGQFARIPLPKGLEPLRSYATAFVDLDNDGWLDLFVSTYQHGNFGLLNQQGRFDRSTPVPLPNSRGIVTVSPSFGDLDRDGDLDIVNGNMAMGVATGFRRYGEGRQSSITWNRGMTFGETELVGPDGEAMASVVSDLNNDGWADVYVNQDFVVPDRFYVGTAQGFRRLTGPAIANFAMPVFSMSADTGDFDNDGRLDFLITGTIAGAQSLTEAIDSVPAVEYKKRKQSLEYCDRIQDPFYKANCRRNREASSTIPFHLGKALKVRDCVALRDDSSRDQCLLAVMWTLITENTEQLECETYAFDPKIEEVCRLMKRSGTFFDRDTFEGQGNQIDTAVLYRAQENHGLERVGKQQFEHPGGWTWSSKFGDLDSDGWLDIVNAEGAVAKEGFGFNVLMHNEGGKRFVQRQFSWGFVNDFNLFSIVLVDYDRDGDLDVVGNGSEGPIQVYRNDLSAHRNVVFQLVLKGENRFGVGAKVFIRTARGMQLRELKAGGGYQSFDAPELHFGVGDLETIEGFTLVTPAGKRFDVTGPLPTQRVYRVATL
ncbi:MAG: FG-GAP-like repeat-containing protein [Myxococcaceae bacterium]